MEREVAHTDGILHRMAHVWITRIKNGEADYQFVEIMACPGGCVNGGGQPHQNGFTHALVNVPGLRAGALYDNDKNSKNRKSHENASVKKLYEEFLTGPGSAKAHELLHTTYVIR